MKILHIDTGLEFRGGQDLLATLAKGLAACGHVQKIACPEGSPLAARLRGEGLDVLGFERGFWRRVMAVRRVLRGGGFDVVHAHDAHAQSIVAAASAGVHVCRVASRHVAFEPRQPLIHRIKYDFTCHGVIALSESVRRVLLGAGVRAEKIEVIPPGIELPAGLAGPEARARARAKWGLAENDFAVGHVAAFTQEKGQDVAVEAAALLAGSAPRVKILLAGDGPLRARLEAAGGQARLVGFVENLAEFYAALDLYIMPSRSEAWGLTALNAMAHGLAVVASNVGGLPEAVEEGRTGWLVPVGDAAALAEAIRAAAADPARLAAMGRQGRARAACFSTGRALARTESFYLRLLGWHTGSFKICNGTKPGCS